MSSTTSVADSAKSEPPQRKRKRAQVWPYLFVLPALLVFLVFSYYPLLRTAYLSMQGTDLFGRPSGFVGLDNYFYMFERGNFVNTLVVTAIFVVATVVLKLIVSLAISVPLSMRFRGTVWLRAWVLVPMAVSVAATGLTFRALLQPVSGPIDRLFDTFGLDAPAWLTDPTWALVTVIIVETWSSISYASLLLLAALDGISDDVLEASSIDGAGVWRQTADIRLPLITPTIFFLIITLTIHALRSFAIINVMTGGGPDGATTTLVIDIYNLAFGTGTADYGASSARGIFLMIVIAVITFIQFRVVERRVHYN